MGIKSVVLGSLPAILNFFLRRKQTDPIVSEWHLVPYQFDLNWFVDGDSVVVEIPPSTIRLDGAGKAFVKTLTPRRGDQ